MLSKLFLMMLWCYLFLSLFSTYLIARVVFGDGRRVYRFQVQWYHKCVLGYLIAVPVIFLQHGLSVCYGASRIKRA